MFCGKRDMEERFREGSEALPYGKEGFEGKASTSSELFGVIPSLSRDLTAPFFRFVTPVGLLQICKRSTLRFFA